MRSIVYWAVATMLCLSAGVAHAEVIIGGPTGDGDFEYAEPATDDLPYSDSPNWFNASGSETINFTHDSQMLGSSQSNSRGGMPYKGRTQVNHTGYTIAATGEVFGISYDFGAGGGDAPYAGTSMSTFLFTASAPVDGALTTNDMTILGGDDYDTSARASGGPQWTQRSVADFYTTTAADVGETVYFGMVFNQPSGTSYPRIDVIELTVTDTNMIPTPPPPNGWQDYVSLYALSGDKTVDADTDGQFDYVEFIHGGDPTNTADLAAVPFVVADANGTISFFSVETAHTNPGIPFAAQWTDDLVAGTWSNAWDAEISAPSARPGYNDVERQLHGRTDDQLFFRVRLLNTAHRPNILVIFTDDQGYADVGFNVEGITDIRTPNLDALAQAGTIFTSAYVAHPFCGPSRVGLFSGRYPHEIGAPYNSNGNYPNQGVAHSETLVSTVLQDADYFTGIMGKWHMGQTAWAHPNARGFDDFWGFLGGGHVYFGPYQPSTGYQENTTYPEHNGTWITTLTSNDYMTDVLSDEGVRFVNQAGVSNQPFFLFMSYNAPHAPIQAKQSDKDMLPHITDPLRLTYAAMVYAVDRGVSNIVAALKANGQYENTLIIFLTDNGGETSNSAENTPLRGKKGDTSEGGFRVPMFMHLPGVIPAGQTYDHPVTALDFYPTFARLAGTAIPPGKDLDGKDIWDDVILTRSARPGEPIYAVRHNVGWNTTGITRVGIRQDHWKATREWGQTWQLFNVTNDLAEATDVSGSHPTILSNLVAAADAWSQDHITPYWYDSLSAEADWQARFEPLLDYYSAVFTLP